MLDRDLSRLLDARPTRSSGFVSSRFRRNEREKQIRDFTGDRRADPGDCPSLTMPFRTHVLKKDNFRVVTWLSPFPTYFFNTCFKMVKEGVRWTVLLHPATLPNISKYGQTIEHRIHEWLYSLRESHTIGIKWKVCLLKNWWLGRIVISVWQFVWSIYYRFLPFEKFKSSMHFLGFQINPLRIGYLTYAYVQETTKNGNFMSCHLQL